MADEIKAGDVVCLKSQKDKNVKQKMTVGSAFSGSQYHVHWFSNGELKTGVVHQDTLHKLE